MSSPREFLAYLLILAVLAVTLTLYRRWRREVIRDRIQRWGTANPRHRHRRRGTPAGGNQVIAAASVPSLPACQATKPWQCLYLAPDPHGHGALRESPMPA